MLQYGCTTWSLTKAKWELHKNATSYIENLQQGTSHKTAVGRPPTSYL